MLYDDEKMIRRAQIKLTGIKKRCRKVDYDYYKAYGDTDEEAIENLKVVYKKAVETYRKIDLPATFEIQDAKLMDSGFISTLEYMGHPMFGVTKEEINLVYHPVEKLI